MRTGGSVEGALTRLGRKFAVGGVRRGTAVGVKICGSGSLVFGWAFAASWRRIEVGRIVEGLGDAVEERMRLCR